VNPKLITLVTSVLLTKPLPMDAWQQLPMRGRMFGLSGAGTSKSLKMLTPTSQTKFLKKLLEQSLALVDGLGQEGGMSDRIPVY